MQGSASAKSLFSRNARTAPAVPSGFSVMLRSPLSLNVYISFCTISVVSPTPRRNSSVCSKTGVRTSRYPASAARLRITLSIVCQICACCGSMSRVPLGACVSIWILPRLLLFTVRNMRKFLLFCLWYYTFAPYVCQAVPASPHCPACLVYVIFCNIFACSCKLVLGVLSGD